MGHSPKSGPRGDGPQGGEPFNAESSEILGREKIANKYITKFVIFLLHSTSVAFSVAFEASVYLAKPIPGVLASLPPSGLELSAFYSSIGGLMLSPRTYIAA